MNFVSSTQTRGEIYLTSIGIDHSGNEFTGISLNNDNSYLECKKYILPTSALPNMSNYLSKTNTTSYTPTGDYHPATKKYVDDALANIDVSFDDVYVVTCGHRFDGGYFEVTDDGSITEMMNKYWPKYLANRNQGGLVIWKDYTAYTNGTTLIGYMRGAEIYIQWPWTPQNNGLSSNPYGSVGVVTITGSWDSSTETYTLTKAVWNRTNYVPTQDYNPANKKYVDDNKYILPTATTDTLGGIKIGDGLSVDENGVVSASGGKTNYLGYIEDYTSDNRLDITNLEKGTYSLGIKDRIGSQTLYLKVSHNGQEQTLDTQLQIEATVVSNMIYFDVRHPIKDISGYDEAIRISFSYLNSITSEIVNTGYGISYNNTSGILSNSARYNTKISAVTTDKEQTIMGKKTFNVLPESSVEPTNDNQFVNKKYVDGNKYELPIASADTLGGIKLGKGLSADENGVVSASGCDIPVYNFKMTSEYRKATSTVTYVYMSSSDKTTLQNIIQDAYDKGLETFALFVNQRVGTYTGTNEMHQDYLLTIVNGKLIKNKPSSLLLAGYSQGNSTSTDVYLSKLNISLPLSWNEDSCTVGTTTYINIELRPLSSDNTIMYVPTSDYNPATKKYVDDQVGNINAVLATLTTVSEVTK